MGPLIPVVRITQIAFDARQPGMNPGAIRVVLRLCEFVPCIPITSQAMQIARKMGEASEGVLPPTEPAEPAGPAAMQRVLQRLGEDLLQAPLPAERVGRAAWLPLPR